MARSHNNQTVEPLGLWAVRHPPDNPTASEVLEWARHTARWDVFPYGFWTEVDGSHVLFDMLRRPIGRKKPDGKFEIVRSVEKIDHVAERLLYGDEGPGEMLTHVKHCLELAERLGLREEIEYRIAISEAGCLPGGKYL